jgi:hypothetical protein
MKIQGKTISGEAGKSSRALRSTSPVHFTPELAVTAIEYHLIDECIAKPVSADSIQGAVNRLRHESFILTVSARTWAAMTNSARLRRLLEETASEAALLPDDTVILVSCKRAGR